jgi:hypothetical protein
MSEIPILEQSQPSAGAQHWCNVNETPEEEPGSKCVVLVGDLTQEGVTTKLKSLGYYYHNKRLSASRPTNWQAAVQLIASRRAAGTLVGVFVEMNTGVFDLCRKDDYRNIWHALIDELGRVQTTIYVYEKALLGDFEDTGWDHNTDLKASIRSTLQSLHEAGLTVLPFQRRYEVTASILQILDELDGGILLRLYVPVKRYQSEQFNSFLHLLENYLRTVEKVSFTIDQRKTDHGLVYVFSSKSDITSADELNAAIARFQEFMDLCEQDTAKAKKILAAASISSAEAESILARYGRDYRRLKLDTKHEYEQKTLLLRQQLEADVLDANSADALNGALALPTSTLPSLVGNSGPISINVTNNAVLTNNVVHLLNGDITFNEQDNRIISLIDQHSNGLDAATLKSALSELKDASSAPEAKKLAGQKVKGFLYKSASLVGEAAVRGLARYVEGLITGTP